MVYILHLHSLFMASKNSVPSKRARTFARHFIYFDYDRKAPVQFHRKILEKAANAEHSSFVLRSPTNDTFRAWRFERWFESFPGKIKGRFTDYGSSDDIGKRKEQILNRDHRRSIDLIRAVSLEEARTGKRIMKHTIPSVLFAPAVVEIARKKVQQLETLTASARGDSGDIKEHWRVPERYANIKEVFSFEILQA